LGGARKQRVKAQPTKRVAGSQGKKTAQGKAPPKLAAMTGKASAAKTAEGTEPVFAYLASLPQLSAASPSASMPWRPKVCRTSSER
jgi:hypothetical protein